MLRAVKIINQRDPGRVAPLMAEGSGGDLFEELRLERRAEE